MSTQDFIQSESLIKKIENNSANLKIVANLKKRITVFIKVLQENEKIYEGLVKFTPNEEIRDDIIWVKSQISYKCESSLNKEIELPSIFIPCESPEEYISPVTFSRRFKDGGIYIVNIVTQREHTNVKPKRKSKAIFKRDSD